MMVQNAVLGKFRNIQKAEKAETSENQKMCNTKAGAQAASRLPLPELVAHGV